MAQILIITGVAILGILGSVHLYFTFFTNNFDPYDLPVKDVMKGTSIILSKDTTVWKAWIGFNASHSLGAIFLAAVYIPLALFHFPLIVESQWFLWLPVVIGLCFLYLAKNYWFIVPFTGILISTICFTAAAILVTINS